MFSAPNFSRGVTLMTWLAAETARRLPGYDAAIVETHHKGKKDALNHWGRAEPAAVLLRVRLEGTIIEHELGYRATRQVVEKVYFPSYCIHGYGISPCCHRAVTVTINTGVAAALCDQHARGVHRTLQNISTHLGCDVDWLTLRRPRVGELRQLRALFVQATGQHFGYFPDSYQKQILATNRLRHLTLATVHPRRPIYIATDGHKIVGYIIAGHGGGEGHVYWLFVDPATRGQNVGLKLLSRAMRQLERQGAKRVVLNTHDHQAYYKRQGFRSRKNWEIEGVPITTMDFTFKRGNHGKV